MTDRRIHEHGLQPGDPAKAAEAILTTLDADEPPLRLALGPDAIDSIRARLDQMANELGKWERLGRQTSFDKTTSPSDA